jgi:deazaflavin-dependent oxidoreductase (nitroreductase family)
MAYDYVKTRREDVKPIENAAGFRRGMKLYTRLNVWIFRLSGGRLMSTAMGGHPICLVEMTGARSGRRLRVPLIHVPDGEEKLLVGSQGGLDRDPVWVRSLRANPDVRITADGRTRAYRARQLEDDEKAAAWPHLCAIYPSFDEYQARTDRNIPVFRCVASS